MSQKMGLFEQAWRSGYPAMGVDAPDEPLFHGLWRGDEFALMDAVATVGVGYFGFTGSDVCGPKASVSLVACVGIHEDLEAIEHASLAPSQARAVALALLTAADRAERIAFGAPQ